MPADFEILELLQIVLLITFLGVTGMFLILTVVNRRRLAGVLVSIPDGPLFGIPVAPVVFAASLLLILFAGLIAGVSVSPVVMLGYLVGAIFWGAATYASTSFFVFDYGIVHGLMNRGLYLPWSWVEDYFSHDRAGSRVRYVFLYRDERGRQRRFEVVVSRSCLVEFSEVVDDILESRFTARLQRSRSRRELKGL